MFSSAATQNTNERSDVSASKGGFPRPPWKSVKKNRVFPVKNEKLFERSEFFSFREMPDFLALERQTALFFRASPQQPVFLLPFSFWWQKEKVNSPPKKTTMKKRNKIFRQRTSPECTHQSNPRGGNICPTK